MVLLMIVSALAGCTTGDPDGDGELGIDPDLLDELIESNLQDFINNTTVTVNQEIHYHNNTTVVNNYDETNNEYSNTTNVEGEEVVNNNYNTYNSSLGGSNGDGSMLHGIDFQFTLDELWGNSEIQPGDRTNYYTVTWEYYDYLTNNTRNEPFTFSCGVYYLINSVNSTALDVYWDNNNYYDLAWDDIGYNSTMRDIFNYYAWNSSLRFTCDENFYGYNNEDEDEGFTEIVYTITVPEGYAFSCSTPRYYALYHSDNNESDPSWDLAQHAGPVRFIFDGIHFYSGTGCQDQNDGNPEIWWGNGESLEIAVYFTYLRENHEYRLMLNYQLRPVVTVE